jgi:hypothetical protein
LSTELSVAQILANLEAQMRLHQEREAHHAAQEAFHREHRALHATEYETIARHYEGFKASAGSAAEIAARPIALAEPAPEAPTKKVQPSRLVARAVAEMPAGESFTPTRIAGEVNRRYREELRQLIDSRLASTALRRLLAEGRLRLIQKGTAHREAVYAAAGNG